MLQPHSSGVAALVLMLVILPVVTMDLQLAAMPDIGRAFNAPVSAVQATLSAFAGVFGLLQLVYGPLSDRLGRKPIIVGGMLLFGLASVGAVLSTSIEMLTAMRMLQAVGATAGPVLGRAAIRDVHGARGAARMLGYVMGAFGLFAIIGPFLGGVLVDAFDWRAAFIGMAGFGFSAALSCWLLFPETRPDAEVRDRASFRQLLRTYAKLLSTRQVLMFVVAGGLMQGAFFAWLAGSPFIIMNLFGYSGTAYGLILPITLVGFIAASFASGRLAGRIPLHRLIVMGLLLAFVSALVGLLLALVGLNALWAIIIPIIGVGIGHGVTLSQCAGGAMAPYPQHAGAASALAGFFQYLGVMTSVALTGLLFDGSALPVIAVMAGLVVAATLVFMPNVRALAAQAS